MLRKIFGLRKGPKNIPTNPVRSRALVKPGGLVEGRSRALKIVHAGGHVERYYMAIPAERIMEKNPMFILTRPEIFRRPWDSIVPSNEMLVPGKKYYIVPRKTVKKLWQRINKEDHQSSESCVSGQKDSSPGSSILIKSGPKKSRNVHVRFNGVKATGPKLNTGQTSVYREEEKRGKERPKICRINGLKHSRAAKESTWEPSLNSIIE